MATTVQSTYNPLWDLQNQHLPGTFEAAQQLYNEGALSPEYYPDQTVADFDPTRTLGINQQLDATTTQQNLSDVYAGTVGTGSGLLDEGAGYLQDVAAGVDPTGGLLAQQAAQAAQGTFGASGTFGSQRAAQAGANAAAQQLAQRQQAAAQQLAQLGTNLTGRAPEAQRAALVPGATTERAGQELQAYNQALIDADRQRYQYAQNQPLQSLQNYQALLGFPGTVSPSTTSTTENQASSLEKAIGVGSLLFGGGSGGLLGGLFAQGGEIHLNPAKKGTFKAQATRMGMSTQEAADKILSAPEGRYSPEMRRKANFAKNFGKAQGGEVRGGLLGKRIEHYAEGGVAAPAYGNVMWDMSGDVPQIVANPNPTELAGEKFLRERGAYRPVQISGGQGDSVTEVAPMPIVDWSDDSSDGVDSNAPINDTFVLTDDSSGWAGGPSISEELTDQGTGENQISSTTQDAGWGLLNNPLQNLPATGLLGLGGRAAAKAGGALLDKQIDAIDAEFADLTGQGDDLISVSDDEGNVIKTTQEDYDAALEETTKKNKQYGLINNVAEISGVDFQDAADKINSYAVKNGTTWQEAANAVLKSSIDEKNAADILAQQQEEARIAKELADAEAKRQAQAAIAAAEAEAKKKADAIAAAQASIAADNAARQARWQEEDNSGGGWGGTPLDQVVGTTDYQDAMGYSSDTSGGWGGWGWAEGGYLDPEVFANRLMGKGVK